MPREERGVLTLTHSSRTTNLARCSVQFLTRRFGDPARLRDLPPFESLPPAEVLYSGAVSFYRVWMDGGRVRLEPFGQVRSRDRIQHVAILGADDLLAGFENRVERWHLRSPLGRRSLVASDIEVVGRFEHPHLVGLHTVEPLGDGRVALACSTPDAVLILDLESGGVERTLRLPPALYGQGYELRESDDLRRHAIPDEAQATHINAAHRAGGSRLVVSTLIQGAIGFFDLASGAYEEICRGFVGCHGARVSAEGEVYFADSAAGTLVFLNSDGRIARCFGTGSRWLHDVQQLAGGVYAFALADSNELRVYDVASGELLWRRRFLLWPLPGMFGAARLLPGWLGNSVQALGFYPARSTTPCP
ncbi:MAG TPA: hypothetical protein VF173_25070 [Thermoanaerobaculia bacterium]|nr:hypothetical protein [Thermoanaerobaculia bacterium]